MPTASNTQSTPVLRYRLSTLFTLFACAAVGLATTCDVLAAPWAAIKAAMVVGLLQQTRELSKWLPDNGGSPRVWHARTFAIAWRISAAAGLLFFLGLEMTGWSISLLYPDREVLFLYEPATVIADLLPIIVLADSVRRWRSNIAAGSSRHLGWWIAAGVLLSIAASNVIDAGCVDYLVHQATAGMEAAIKPEFQRSGVYPDHASEGFRSFWISFAAAAMVPLGAAFLMSASNRWKTVCGKLSGVAFVLCLAVQMCYCVWFYTSDYPRVSPELAGAGFAARKSDLFAGAMLLAVLATPAAYFLTAVPRERSILSDNLAVELDSRSIHETAPVIIILGLWGVVNLVMSLVSALGNTFSLVMSISHLNPWMKLWMNSSAITSPLILLLIVPSLLAVQLCYYRWKRRRECVSWELPALPGAAFAWNWLAVATAIAIGTPTLAAFGFMFWLGPFNFSGL
jgi:hypothetical protein